MFKNARFWRFTRPYNVGAILLAAALQEDALKPLGPQERKRSGWIPVFDDQFVMSDGCLLFCLQTDERRLPAHVVTRYARARAQEFQEQRGEPVGRREFQEIKEQIELELLPRAFVKTSTMLAFIDPESGTVVVDSKSNSAAESLLSLLRKSMGSLPVRPPSVQASPRFTMTGWLDNTVEAPDEIVPGESCEMHGLSEKSAKIKVKGLDLYGEEVSVHVKNGLQVVSLYAEFDGAFVATVHKDISLQGIKWTDLIREKLEDVDAEDREALLRAEFYLSSRELLRCLSVLLEPFGGEDVNASH